MRSPAWRRSRGDTRSLRSPTAAAACAPPRLNARSVGRPRTTSRKWSRAGPALGSLLGAPGGVATHEDHEDRHQRERDDHDRGGDHVDRDDPGDDRGRHEGCEHELGQKPAEVGLERRGSEDRGGGELGALGAVERRRPVDEPASREREPKLREDARCREPPDGLEGPCEPARAAKTRRSSTSGRVSSSGRARERAGNHAREQRRLGDHQHGGHQADRHIGGEQEAHRACTAEEPGVERARGRPPQLPGGAGAVAQLAHSSTAPAVRP